MHRDAIIQFEYILHMQNANSPYLNESEFALDLTAGIRVKFPSHHQLHCDDV
jgi:hypothetical protein